MAKLPSVSGRKVVKAFRSFGGGNNVRPRRLR